MPASPLATLHQDTTTRTSYEQLSALDVTPELAAAVLWFVVDGLHTGDT